jgi:molybdenum cofactor biosynthesis enzyme
VSERTATVRAFDRPGVEIEALTAVTVAAPVIYDPVKALDRGGVECLRFAADAVRHAVGLLRGGTTDCRGQQ